MADITVVGSDIPSGGSVAWYYGGAEARMITEDLVESAGVVTLTKVAEYGCVLARTAADAMSPTMEELTTISPDVAATDATGTKYLRTSAAGTDTMTVSYLDTETTALKQIIGCKDVSSPFSIDTKETEVHNQSQKLQLTGAGARTFTAEQVYYNLDFLGAIYGDLIADSPAAGMYKFTDKHTSIKKLSAVVGKWVVDGSLIRKWFYIGLQVTKIDNSHPTADFYTNSMDFTVDSMVMTDVVPN
ncbi:MAG: hypothetical protein DRI69_09655 [Bacteroidetes bacterium]|nr:MAG: hypothetical protein DRI69_09655 [Bacteroidota bacterium]